MKSVGDSGHRGESMLPVEPQHNLIPDLAASLLMRREQRLYRASCPCTRRVHQRARLLQHQLNSVIVFDIRFHWWGLGNNLNRWLTLLRIGLASGRATFLWMSSETGATPRALNAGVHFDLGSYFMGDGWSWRWTEAVRQRVRERMSVHNISEPTVIYHVCKRHGLECEEHELQWQGTLSSRSIPGTLADERNGGLVRLLTSAAERWLLIRPWNRGPSTAFQPSAHMAVAVLGGQVGRAWGGGWGGAPTPLWEGGCWRPQDRARAVRDLGRTEWTLGANATAAMQATEAIEPVESAPSGVGGALRSRLSMRCDAFALLRPRRSLQRHMAPLVQRLDALRQRTGALTALHVRTGYVDWVALAMAANGSARAAWRAATAMAPLPLTVHWRALDTYLEDCSTEARQSFTDHRPRVHGSWQVGPGLHPAAPAAPAALALPPWPCYRWTTPHRGRAPSTADALARCGPRGGRRGQEAAAWPSVTHDAALAALLPSNGTLAAAVLCASRLQVEPQSPLPAGLVVLGDAPAITSLVSTHPALANRTVTADVAGTGALGHTQFASACAVTGSGARATAADGTEQREPAAGVAGGCAHGVANPQGGWTRTMVDFYIGGLVDNFVSVLDTTFVGAVLRRSLIFLGRGTYVHFAAASTATTNRDRPMEHVDFLHVLMSTAVPDP